MDSLLDKLKVKPNPQKKEQVKVKMPNPEIFKGLQVKAKLVDKRGELELDRSEILKKIRNPPIVKRKPEKPQKLAPSEPTSETKIKVKKPKKIKGKKLKIVPITKGTISTHGVVEQKRLPPPQKTTLPRTIEGRPEEIVYGEIITPDRLPKKLEKIIVKSPQYYMNNREIFIQFINRIFKRYREQILKDKTDFADFEGDIVTEKCKKGESNEFSLLTHQKIVRDYLNLYTPYRGLLLYHGLGSGKTCSSIAIAEGMKTSQRVIVMTPASLRRNYVEELKYCGDPLYKKNQFWEFISIDGRPELVDELHKVLSLSREFITKNNGAWLVNIKKNQIMNYWMAMNVKVLNFS